MVRARDDIEGLDAAILMHPRVWEASGHVAGFSDPLVDCRNCKKRFRADDPKIKGTPGTPDGQCPSCGMKGTLSEPRDVQPDVQDVHGPGRGQRVGRLSAAGNRAGHLCQLSERPAVDAAEGAVRHRADRQGVSERDHAGKLHLSHPRVRADGDAVLRRARHRHALVRLLEGAAHGVAQVARARPEAAALPSAHEGRARALRARRVRHPVRLWWHPRFPRNRGRAQPRRLRPHAAPGILGQEARVLRPAEQPALRAVRRRDVRRRRSHDARHSRERRIAKRRSRAKTKAAPCSASIRRSRRSRPASFRS